MGGGLRAAARLGGRVGVCVLVCVCVCVCVCVVLCACHINLRGASMRRIAPASSLVMCRLKQPGRPRGRLGEKNVFLYTYIYVGSIIYLHI